MNVYGVVLELARQELIQKPYLMVVTWRNALVTIKRSFPDVKSIQDLYSKISPTNMKVVKLLEGNPKNIAERDVLSYLRQYVMGLETTLLKTFLHFVTGADIILVEKIEIMFIVFETINQRRPIAHTCQLFLEIASAYRSFSDLRDEFNMVLSKKRMGDGYGLM
eukprot:TCONS_00035134-protein